jgi:hypothetical protein
MLWDPNRQGIQDKAAHTVVLDLRATAAAAPDVVPTATAAAQTAVPVETAPRATPPTA